MECPTNNDPTFDGRPRIKRTTGIPKSFLKTIEKPATLINDGTLDDTKQPSGIMVNADGEWVIAEPDQAAWNKYQAQAKVSAAAQNAASLGSKELQDRGIECAIDKRLFVDPSKTPCCQTTYCHECIQNALLDNDLRCPHCFTENVPIDDLIPNDEVAAKVRQYEEEKAEGSQTAKEAEDSPNTQKSKNASPVKHTTSLSQSPINKPSVPQIATTGNGTPKKRSAESELENDRRPVGKGKQDNMSTSSIANNERKLKQETFKQQSHQATANGINMYPSTYNNSPVPSMNSFMGMGVPMPMSMTMQNPLMMPTAPFISNGWGVGQQPNMNIGGGAIGHGALYNGTFSQQNLHNLPINNHANMYAMGSDNRNANTQFSNQQRSSNEEESAYFRKPVNPNRQYNRKNWNQSRSADYREI